MGNVFPWIGGGIAVVMGLVALFMAAATSDSLTQTGGPSFSCFASSIPST